MNKIINFGIVAGLAILVLTIHQHHKTVDRIVRAQENKIIELQNINHALRKTSLEKFCNSKHLCVDMD